MTTFAEVNLIPFVALKVNSKLLYGVNFLALKD